MTTTDTYVVTDLHPRRHATAFHGVRLPLYACRFVKADMIALWMVARFCAPRLGRILNTPVRSDGMPLWWVLIWGYIFGRIALAVIAAHTA